MLSRRDTYGDRRDPVVLRARWGRWLADTPAGKQLCKRWKEWVAGQVKKYFWDIDPEDKDHPTPHGLRGTGILARAEAGYHMCSRRAFRILTPSGHLERSAFGATANRDDEQ